MHTWHEVKDQSPPISKNEELYPIALRYVTNDLRVVYHDGLFVYDGENYRRFFKHKASLEQMEIVFPEARSWKYGFPKLKDCRWDAEEYLRCYTTYYED